MKKILVVANDLEIGGAERALLGLLDSFDKNEYQIDLFLLKHTGAFMKFIPNGINLLPENSKYSDLGIPIKNVFSKGHLDMAYGRFKGKLLAKQFIKKNGLKNENSVEIHYSYKYTLKYLPKISDEVYDLALGFTTPYYILDKKVFAKNKAVWIHTDYSALDGDRKEELKVWNAYPYIISISDSVTNSFLKVYPQLRKKIYPVENIVSEKIINDQANLFSAEKEMPNYHNEVKILSIGRYTKAKNFDNVPNICSRLIKKGLNVKWYIIGYGNDEELIKKNIVEENMENHVILLGKKENPYPYIKQCDIYIQPSRFEGKAVSVKEAQILHKPVIITDFPTADSQFKNKIDGIIVPMENEKCADNIAKIINNSDILNNLIDNCTKTNYSNSKEIEKIYELIK